MTTKDFIESLYRIAFYYDDLDQIIKCAEMYPITVEEIRRIARLASIMDTERGPGFTYNFLRKGYAKYHQWEREQ